MNQKGMRNRFVVVSFVLIFFAYFIQSHLFDFSICIETVPSAHITQPAPHFQNLASAQIHHLQCEQRSNSEMEFKQNCCFEVSVCNDSPAVRPSQSGNDFQNKIPGSLVSRSVRFQIRHFKYDRNPTSSFEIAYLKPPTLVAQRSKIVLRV